MTSLAKTLRSLSFAGALTLSLPALAQPTHVPADPDPAAHAFDFEFGSWKAHLSRRLKPLTGSNTWVEYDGTSVVKPVWNGAANLGELELDGSAGHIEGLSLRVYNPATHQWGISYANRAGGSVGLPMFGGFKDGRGRFYAQDTLNDRMILVRFIFSDLTTHAFQLEQAFSDDGGQTWEPNWIAKFTR
ncbi:MAG: hypothetical protein ABJC74_16840 [Gemmatimonadota bacterium]